MNVVLIAATGRAGNTILNELISRDHQVIAVVRDRNKLPHDLSLNIKSVVADLNNLEQLSEIITSADVVVSAFGPSSHDQRYFNDTAYTDQLVEVTKNLIEVVGKNKIPRLIVVGGCGSLEFSPGVTVLDSGYWPKEYVPIALSHVKAFGALKASNINWTYFSPPMMITPGERTGKFRLGTDSVIFDDHGKNTISYEDYAVALVDEIENPKNEGKRFTIGY